MENLFHQWGIALSEKQINQFRHYYELLIEWNSKMNLTSITDWEEVKVKHFLDSIALLQYINLDDLKNKKIIDVGTGAGFPGIPLAIMCPETQFVLLDSLNKRVQFLEEVISSCNITNCKAIHGRAEDEARNSEYREQFDYSVSRAVANMSTLLEYCIPFVKVGGLFLPYKSMKTDEELSSSRNALTTLGSDIVKIEKFQLPFTDMERSIVFIQKNKTTDSKYPRKAGKPTKKPL